MQRQDTLIWMGLLAAVATGRVVAPAASAGTYVAAQEVSVEGCLRPGSAAGEYIVSVAGARHTATARPGVRLDEHLHHRVQLTGALADTAIGPVFVVSDVRTLAPTCATTR